MDLPCPTTGVVPPPSAASAGDHLRPLLLHAEAAGRSAQCSTSRRQRALGSAAGAAHARARVRSHRSRRLAASLLSLRGWTLTTKLKRARLSSPRRRLPSSSAAADDRLLRRPGGQTTTAGRPSPLDRSPPITIGRRTTRPGEVVLDLLLRRRPTHSVDRHHPDRDHPGPTRAGQKQAAQDHRLPPEAVDGRPRLWARSDASGRPRPLSEAAAGGEPGSRLPRPSLLEVAAGLLRPTLPPAVHLRRRCTRAVPSRAAQGIAALAHGTSRSSGGGSGARALGVAEAVRLAQARGPAVLGRRVASAVDLQSAHTHSSSRAHGRTSGRSPIPQWNPTNPTGDRPSQRTSSGL